MGSLNDLLLPVVDATEEVWASIFCPQELASLKSLVNDLHQPMLNMGAVFPLDVHDRLSTTLQVLTGAVDVSSFQFYQL